MSKDLPYMKYFPSDFYGDPMVQVMTDDQELIYHRFIARSWQMGALPDDEERLAAIAGVGAERFKAAWCWPLTEKWVKNREGLINHRVEDEREDAYKRSEYARKGGKEKQRRRAARVQLQHNPSTATVELQQCYPAAILESESESDPEKEKNKTGGAGGVHEEPKSKKKPKRDVKAQLREIHEWFDTLPTHQGQPIDEAVGRVGSTHLSGKLTSIQKIEFIHRGRSYGVEAMVSGCKVYNDGEMQARGYDVDYLIGIIRKEATRCKKKILMDS